MQEHDLVVLTQDRPDHGLEAGDVGTLVHCYADGEAFEVEFTRASARRIGVLTLEKAELRDLEEGEILHARRLPGAGSQLLVKGPRVEARARSVAVSGTIGVGPSSRMDI